MEHPSSGKKEDSESSIDSLGSFYQIIPRRDWPGFATPSLKSDSGNKTVLFLGAGASACEVVPVQGRLLHYAEKYCSPKSKIGLDLDWKIVVKFLQRLAPGVPIDRRQLEDCLTFLDKAEVSQEVIAGFGRLGLVEPRRALMNCISHTIAAAQRGQLDLEGQELASRRRQTPMVKLGKFLRKEAKTVRGRWSIVSTNWDTTLDFALGGKASSVIDYCTYTNPWERYYRDLEDESDRSRTRVREVPSIWKRPLGRPTVKLLKLHGSLNWLWCPTCSRLFVSSTHNIGLRGTVRSGLKPYRRRFYCPECRIIAGSDYRAPILREVLVTPTMLKRLDMVHLRMIWYNALVEIAEAKRVIFVGYTAPLADFELRYMLAKAFSVRQTRPKVYVISRGQEDPEQLKKLQELKENYEGLLGDSVESRGYGVDGLVDRLVKGDAL